MPSQQTPRQSVGNMCGLQQAFSSICQGATSDRASGSTAKQPGSEIDSGVRQAMDTYLGRNLKFVEHLVVATVAEFIEGEIIENLVHDLNTAMALPGVLATHVGRCEPMLGEHTFMIHIRAVDTAACDAAYRLQVVVQVKDFAGRDICVRGLCGRTASEVYGKHLILHNINREKAFGDIIIVDFNSDVIGASDAKWPAIRIAVFEYKSDASEEKKEGLIQVLSLLPTLFPSVKQVSWGRNIAKERTYRKHYGYADVDHELGVILGFSCCQDMYALGADPKYWELLNFHGISLLEKYQVLTFCMS